MTGSLLVAGAATSSGQPWMAQEGHRRWLADQTRTLADFARPSVRADGAFWWLDDHGRPDLTEPLHTWIACRMTHVFALAQLRGDESAGPLADHGLAALNGLLRDETYGGWYASVGLDGATVDAGKAAYPHAFVVLAASTALRAGRPGARRLLDEALDVVTTRFWDDEAGRTIESWSRDWRSCEPYRGANSSMHMVEAFLAAGDATGDPRWNDRALRICAHLIDQVAATHDWRLPEHFTPDWSPRLDYNVNHPADPFRPYGYTIGHALEWSRLLLHVEAAMPEPPAWLLAHARSLFAMAMSRGWAVDGADGFVYTLDWQDKPVVRARMHWVLAEAIGAAAVLAKRTGDEAYETWYRTLWEYAQRYVIDTERGSWIHELDPTNEPASTVWHGKPDVYHAYQAALLPQLPLASTLAGPRRADDRPGSPR